MARVPKFVIAGPTYIYYCFISVLFFLPNGKMYIYNVSLFTSYLNYSFRICDISGIFEIQSIKTSSKSIGRKFPFHIQYVAYIDFVHFSINKFVKFVSPSTNNAHYHIKFARRMSQNVGRIFIFRFIHYSIPVPVFGRIFSSLLRSLSSRST